MAGVAAEIELQGMDEVQRRLGRLSAFDRGETMFALGELLASSVKERIDTEKASPEGEDWLPWTERYDETRSHAKHSLLIEEGGLQESIQSLSTSDEVRVGSNLIYAATHQFGDEERGIPARPYLGLSDEDREDVADLILGDLEDAVR